MDSRNRAQRTTDQPSSWGLSSIKLLARALFEARRDVGKISDALATCLTASLCDGCSIVFAPGPVTMSPATRHRGGSCDELLAPAAPDTAPFVHAFKSSDDARATLPAYSAYIERFGLRGLAILPLSSGTRLRGSVVVTRDRGSRAFDNDDLVAIETCVEYASLAAESALQLEAEQALSTTDRERASQFQHELARIVGHDLRAPISAILMATEILAARSKDDPAAAYAVTRIVSFAKRTNRMVDQLLDLSRMRLGGGIAIARSPMRLLPMIETVIEDLKANQPGCQFELVGEEIKGIWDLDRLTQVMTDVLGNAVNFGLESATISVKLASAESLTTIAIHNELREGPMSPETLATLFAPYRRGWDPEHIGSGLGLALYLAHAIVQAHGGTISAESSQQAGTTFQIVLPNTLPD